MSYYSARQLAFFHETTLVGVSTARLPLIRMQSGVQTAAAAAAQLEVRQSRAAKETDLDFCALRNRMRTTTMLP